MAPFAREDVIAHASVEKKESLSQQVVHELQSKGKVGLEPTIKTKTIKGSVYTDHLIFIKDKKSCPMVAKVFRNLEDFLLENKQLKEEDAYIGTANELKTSCGYPLPIITRRLGKIELQGVGVILLEKAKGKTLKDIYMNLESMQDSKIKEIYHMIGAQFGELDSLTFANKHQILFYPDGHHANFLYDEKTINFIGLIQQELNSWKIIQRFLILSFFLRTLTTHHNLFQ